LIESILRLSIEKRGIVLMLMLILLITGLGL
jgi:Cu/Ag efflux pump CusA